MLERNDRKYACFGDRCLTPVASSDEPVYDADGNLIEDDRFEYVYDDENRLVSVYPISPDANDLAVENFYDHLHRRIRKAVYKYVDNDWTLHATHTFVWDGMNIVLERIAYEDNTTRTCEYYWGPDRSGTEQGAGGVEGLLAVSIDGTFYFPLYGDNANIVGYISEAGTLVAQYVYDPYGNITETYGPSPDLFAFGFSTKYHDRELGLIAYQRRYYNPQQGRWLNRDPIEEEGGRHLYAFCRNFPVQFVDVNGAWTWTKDEAEYCLRTLIGEWRGLGWNFPADALDWFLRNTGTNLDLSQYSHLIAEHKGWRHKFLYDVIERARKKDPGLTGTVVEIGDDAHASSFVDDLRLAPVSTFGRLFSPLFDYRFHYAGSKELFYALYGSRYSYYGRVSVCRKTASSHGNTSSSTLLKLDLHVASWDQLTYPRGFLGTRNAFPSYSAAHHLQNDYNVTPSWIYLRWFEKGKWRIDSSINSNEYDVNAMEKIEQESIQ